MLYRLSYVRVEAKSSPALGRVPKSHFRRGPAAGTLVGCAVRSP